MKRTKPVAVREHRGLTERLHALGWVSTGWEPASRSWRFVDSRSGQTQLVKASSEVEALDEVVERLEAEQDGRPEAMPSFDSA
jgi:hypothetical protein